MPKCFVIQPFDDGKFDKRYKQIFAPAIEAADATPYRVDEDASVEVPIEAIERGIREAAICLADITTNNPNVWFELGYAIAIGRPVVMVCSSEREGKYPFDIQHRSVIRYESDAPGDHDDLRKKITEKLKILLSKREALKELSGEEPIAPVAGLTQSELTVLAIIAGEADGPDDWASRYTVKTQSEREFLTPLGFSLALKRLSQKGFVEFGVDQDYNGNEYATVKVNGPGWDWIDQNESRFVIRRESRRSGPADDIVRAVEITDDDIPF